MRYIQIFSLYFQNTLAHRSRQLIYVFTYFISALIFYGFMKGVFENNNIVQGWNFNSITSYYFLLIPIAGALVSHPEFPIVRDDIERGELAGKLLKPFSYYWQRFYMEIPARIFQGIVGSVLFIILSILFNNFIEFNLSVLQILLLLIIYVLAFFICFTLKMSLAITSFWTTEIRGLREIFDTIIFIFAGYVVPINLLPSLLERIAYISPFPYIIYYPLIAIQGELSINEMLTVIFIQLFWVFVLVIIFRFQWKRGIIRFADLGH